METAVRQRRVALSILLTASFMGALDGFIVTVAVPSIQRDLTATFGEMQLVVAGYATVFAAGLSGAGRLGDRHGHRDVFMWGMAFFAGASLACGVAPTADVLVVARLVQGAGAAAMLPQVLSIVRATFPAAERGGAIGWYGAVVGLGVVCGPALGGLLLALDLTGLGWRWVFLVNVPLGVAVLAGAPLLVPASAGDTRGRLDVRGLVLACAGLGVMLVSLTQGAEAGWPPWTLGCLVVGPLALARFVAHERRVGERAVTPLLPLRLFDDRVFSSAVATLLMITVAGTSAPLLFCLTYHLQDGLGLSALQTGLLLTPVGIGYALGSALAPRLFARHGRHLLVAGMTTTVTGLAVLAATVGASSGAAWSTWVMLVPVLFVAATGQGLATNPLITLLLSRVEPVDAGAASSVYLTTGQLGNALGLAVVGSIYLALLGGDVAAAGPAAYSRALAWTAALLALTLSAAMLCIRRLVATRHSDC